MLNIKLRPVKWPAGRGKSAGHERKKEEISSSRQRKATHDPNPHTQETGKVESILLGKKHGATDDRLPENEEWRRLL